MSGSRHRLLERLDRIEKRIARLSSADPTLQRLDNRIQEQRDERAQARARLAALDEKLARLTARPDVADSAVRESLLRHVDSRLPSAEQELHARLSRESATPPSNGSPPREQIMRRVAELESAVAAQHTAIVELRDCSIKTEQTMQKILKSVDSIVSRNLDRTSR